MYLEELNIDKLERCFSDLQQNANSTMLALVAEEELFFVNEMIEFFNFRNVNVFGGIFPGLVYKGHQKKKGAIIKEIPSAGSPILFEDLSEVDEGMTLMLDRIKESAKCTAFVFFDGFTTLIKDFLSQTYLKFGTSVNYIGGGTGTSDYIQKPSVFTNKGIFQDAAVMCLVTDPMKIAVRHRWDWVAAPSPVPPGPSNWIKTINWQNAYQVYKEALNEHRVIVKRENLYETAWTYPLGIYREDHEFILRSPIQLNKNHELVCLGEVPENSAIYILEANKDSLLQASATAVFETLKTEIKYSASFGAIDYARSVFLQEAFEEELMNAHNRIRAKNPASWNFGALTIGEVASFPSGSMELFNKSFAIGAFYDHQ